MTSDAHAAAQFYGTARGAVACRLLRERLLRAWPNLAGLRVLGVGFPAPYLRPWSATAARCIAALPAHGGAPPPAADGPGLSCVTGDDALPFADLSFDRILLVHGLEAAHNARALLREAWRVLKDDGRLLVVAPNRMGMWAHVESTPFGHGQPYSPGQISRLLARSLFRVEQQDTALHLPPANLRVVLRSARLLEAGGRHLAPRLAGVIISEAVKDVYAGLPLQQSPQRRLVFSQAA